MLPEACLPRRREAHLSSRQTEVAWSLEPRCCRKCWRNSKSQEGLSIIPTSSAAAVRIRHFAPKEHTVLAGMEQTTVCVSSAPNSLYSRGIQRGNGQAGAHLSCSVRKAGHKDPGAHSCHRAVLSPAWCWFLKSASDFVSKAALLGKIKSKLWVPRIPINDVGIYPREASISPHLHLNHHYLHWSFPFGIYAAWAERWLGMKPSLLLSSPFWMIGKVFGIQMIMSVIWAEKPFTQREFSGLPHTVSLCCAVLDTLQAKN